MKRPEHAADCPGCKTGWVVYSLLCGICTKAVQAKRPSIFDSWREAKEALQKSEPPPAPPGGYGWAAVEAFRRGVIVGTALLLSEQREAESIQWNAKRAQRKQWRAAK